MTVFDRIGDGFVKSEANGEGVFCSVVEALHGGDHVVQQNRRLSRREDSAPTAFSFQSVSRQRLAGIPGVIFADRRCAHRFLRKA